MKYYPTQKKGNFMTTMVNRESKTEGLLEDLASEGFLKCSEEVNESRVAQEKASQN
jgi:hypothetical protein